MINVYKSKKEIGIVLFDLETSEFLYAEKCNRERLMTFITSFPDHEVQIYIEREWREDLQELFFLLPHLQDIATIHLVNKVNVDDSIKSSAQNKVTHKYPFMYFLAGIILGTLLLIPTVSEYRSSVLTQAKVTEGFAEKFVASQPEQGELKQLYTSIQSLYHTVSVEAITYSEGGFEVIFSSVNSNLTLGDLGVSQADTLKLVSTLKQSDGYSIHIYKMEGEL